MDWLKQFTNPRVKQWINQYLKIHFVYLNDLAKLNPAPCLGGLVYSSMKPCSHLVVNNALHIRSCDLTIEQFKSAGYEPYVYKKRGFPVVTKYYALPDTFWNTPEEILSLASIALKTCEGRENRAG